MAFGGKISHYHLKSTKLLTCNSTGISYIFIVVPSIKLWPRGVAGVNVHHRIIISASLSFTI